MFYKLLDETCPFDLRSLEHARAQIAAASPAAGQAKYLYDKLYTEYQNDNAILESYFLLRRFP